MQNRVVITGLGAITPLGNSVAATWEAVCAGRSGIGPITRFETEQLKTKIAGEIKDLDPLAHVSQRELKKLDMFMLYGTVAAEMAMEDAGLKDMDFDRERFGVVRNLEICEGSAPAVLGTLPDPDAVFLGGGGRQLPQLLACCWQRLRPGGRLVASAVTENSRAVLNEFAANADTELTQIAVSRSALVGEQRLLRPLLPVLLLKRVKR